MSQILKIDSITINNLNLAKKVANKNFIYSEGGMLSGIITTSKVDHLFENRNSTKNFGLIKSENGYSIICDTDHKKEINTLFTSLYNKELIEREAQLAGLEIESVIETENEIILNFN